MSIEILGIVPTRILPVTYVLSRFTAQERVNIRSSPSAFVQDWWEMLCMKESVDVQGAFYLEGVALLGSEGCITAERKPKVEEVVYK